MKKLLFLSVLLIAVAFGALAMYVREELRMPGQTGLVEIPKGFGAREVVGLLEDKKVISDQYVALAYLFYTRAHGKLQAGEYMFEKPMTIPEVMNRLTTGAVFLHKFTVPEGLTLAETAYKWQEQGFGKAEEFIEAADGAVESVRRFDDKAESAEGYLYPETYSFPSRVTARQAIDAMVGRFKQMVEHLTKTVPQDRWPLSLRETVILASLVESEAAREDERPLIASVYLNRLERHILLQCDPTVIYALQQADRYRGSLTLADLQFNSPYNTYLNAGLPPGPIANPGYPALLASIQPADTKYFYFVRSLEGGHTFSETLAAHSRAVSAYRKTVKPPRGKPTPDRKISRGLRG